MPKILDSDTDSKWAKTTKSHKRRRNWLAEQVLQHYGRACECCETETGVSIWPQDLTRRKREYLGDHPKRSGSFNGWLVSQGFPEGFRSLCTPCAVRKQGNWPCDPETHRRMEDQ